MTPTNRRARITAACLSVAAAVWSASYLFVHARIGT